MQTFTPKGNIHGPILPGFILGKKLSLGAKVMYALLCDFAGEKDHCWPSHATLAARLDCSVSTVKNYLGELCRENLIAVHRERYRSSTYYLLSPLKTQGTSSGYQKAKSGYPKSGYINTLNVGDLKYPPLPPASRDTPSCAAKRLSTGGGGGFLSANKDFEKLYAAYPKKDAKELARSVWHRLWRRGEIPSIEILLEALERFRATESWNREHGRFVPQLVNWLRGQRWLDPETSLPQAHPASPGTPSRSASDTAAMLKALEDMRRPDPALEELKPSFNAFAACFADGQKMRGPAFGLWFLMKKKGRAPLSSDVTVSDMGIYEFLKEWDRKAKCSI